MDVYLFVSHNQPLMQRVQAALKAQLTRQNEKLEIELREKVEGHICTNSIRLELLQSNDYLRWRP